MRERPADEGLGQEVEVQVQAGPVLLLGSLGLVPGAQGVVLFAHGSGSGRFSPRNRFVAQELRRHGLATLLIDLLTEEEEAIDIQTHHLRFDIPLLAQRLVGATDWLLQDSRTSDLAIGYFGASTGAGAALVAAAQHPQAVAAIVSRGGRPDLAGEALPLVVAPTLFIVGGYDFEVMALNREAMARMTAPKEIAIVPGATHLFEEQGALEEVTRLATDWFLRYLRRHLAKSA